ncbi:hypothetical protein D3C85_1490720 [compost metagenome]
MQREIVQHRNIRLIAKADLLEHNFARYAPIRSRLRFLCHLRLQIQHFKYALRSGNGGLKQIVLVGQLIDRLAELIGVIQKADNDPDGDEFMVGKNAAEYRDDQKG